MNKKIKNIHLFLLILSFYLFKLNFKNSTKQKDKNKKINKEKKIKDKQKTNDFLIFNFFIL